MIDWETFVEKANKRWSEFAIWHPMIMALALVTIIAILHKVHWETTAETNPGKIWDGKTFSIVDPGEGEN
ncbi:MAG: hypothetical protein NZ820_12380, partial [Dehalococcoidia bacterium]|nr:hypothetical protein [Dehalococcoidia bacterium]